MAETPGPRGPSGMTEFGVAASQLTEQKVRQVLKARRIREQQLGADLFTDPAWDILLEALAAELGQKQNSVSDLVDATSVPRSTALRWIKKLEEDGWLERKNVAIDSTRKLLVLTSQSSQRLRHYFEAAGSCLLLV